MHVPVRARGPLHMAIRGGPWRLVEPAGRDDRLAPAARQMRHRTAAVFAERGRKASRAWQVEAHDGGLAAQPAQRCGLDDHLAGMRRAARLAAPRAVAVQKGIEGTLDLERNLAAQ